MSWNSDQSKLQTGRMNDVIIIWWLMKCI